MKNPRPDVTYTARMKPGDLLPAAPAPAAAARPGPRPPGLWKTTAVFFSDYDPMLTPVAALARDAADGDAYCPVTRTVYVPDPLADPDWDGTGFFGPHDDDPDEDAPGERGQDPEVGEPRA